MSAGGGYHLQLAKLIADPCAGPLVAPEYGSSDNGYLSRFTSYVNMNITQGYFHGYCVWFPDFVGQGANATVTANSNGSWYIFQTTGTSTEPVNTTSAPLGCGASTASTNGRFWDDPARGWVEGDHVLDARTAAACIKFTYTGRMDSLSGRVGYLNNIPRSALILGGSGNQAPSVDDMLRYSEVISRTPADTIENKFRPGLASGYYRGAGDIVGEQRGTDSCFVTGIPGFAETVMANDVSSGSATGIGFVWTNLPGDSAIVLDATKAIEWRPQMSVGLCAPPSSTPPGHDGSNMVSKAVHYLDRAHPGWQRTAMQTLGSAASNIASMAFGGPANSVIRAGVKLLTG
jgi:hypothetical protein